MAKFARCKLSLAARLLALTLACRARRACDGQYYVWRGRKALSKLTGLSTRCVTTARRELVEAGLFLVTYPSTIETPEGVFEIKRGVPVLQLIENPAAFVEAREAARTVDQRTVDRETQWDRLEIQRRYLRGQLSLDDCRQQEANLRRRYRRERRVG
jgi:hypothetical protein